MLAERRWSPGLDRVTVAVAAGVLGVVVIALIVAALLRDRETTPDLSTPRGVVLAYAQAEARGDGQTAWDLLADSAHRRGDRDRYLARVGSGVPSSPRTDYLSTEPAVIDAGGATASVVLVRTFASSGGLFPASSNSTRSTVRLALEDGAWRITVPPDDYILGPAPR